MCCFDCQACSHLQSPHTSSGKLRRVEEERRDYFEEMARLNDLLKSHESEATSSREKISALEDDLENLRQTSSDSEQSANRRVQVRRPEDIIAVFIILDGKYLSCCLKKISATALRGDMEHC